MRYHDVTSGVPYLDNTKLVWSTLPHQLIEMYSDHLQKSSGLYLNLLLCESSL